MIRRIVSLGFCALAFWAGMQVQQFRTSEACERAGGALRDDMLCIGGAP